MNKDNATQRKTALITGIGGQDGAYLAQLLIGKATKLLVHRGMLAYRAPIRSCGSV